ncbi:FAD-binding oxidoreductase [Mangrovicoccus sp. HB161399]|uniref:NAD(P)/FAD-dependent oxidoreductase n=1 Tax=Mangrovicoccus sp. HB161399 TaxID=2720392 RepID=UPI001554094C|nr:FAD-dependent oxidoreductase [Mangrovicoccus sp. HB161399]
MSQIPYESAAYEASSVEGCYWTATCAAPDCPPLEGEAQAEAVVVGAGYTGLSAALHLARAGMDVAVLDRHGPGWGASGRNGGFACIGGSKLDRGQMVRAYGAEARAEWVRAEREAIGTVERLAGELGIGIDRHSDGEAMLAHSARAMADIRADAGPAGAEYGVRAEVLEPESLAERGLSAAGMHGGLRLPVGFGLNPRKYVTGLARGCLAAGVRIHGNSAVARIVREGGAYLIQTPSGRLRARRLVLATNGYASDDLPDWMRARFLPVQSSVLVTRPITAEERQAQGWTSDLMAYDSRHLLHYFRMLPEGRFLFGMRGGIRWTPAAHRKIRAQMRADFEAMFPAWTSVETPFFWSGLANLTRRLVPHVGPVGDWPDSVVAFGYHGNGVAMASWSGLQAAKLLLGEAHGLPGFVMAAPKRFELGRARRLALAGAYVWYGLLDRR